MTVTPPPVAPPSHPAAAWQKTSGLAVAALVLGICGIIPCLGVLLGLIGIVLGIVALARNVGGKGFAVGGIIAGLVGIVIGQALLVSMLMPALNRAREQAKRALCAGNLNGIAKGIIMYGTENQDAFPPNLDVLVRQGKVPRKMLQCPSVERRRRCDYFYLAPSAKGDDVPDDLLVACDLRDNHDGEGRNVMYATGYVKWLKEKAFQAELGKPVNAAFAAALRKAEGP